MLLLETDGETEWGLEPLRILEPIIHGVRLGHRIADEKGAEAVVVWIVEIGWVGGEVIWRIRPITTVTHERSLEVHTVARNERVSGAGQENVSTPVQRGSVRVDTTADKRRHNELHNDARRDKRVVLTEARNRDGNLALAVYQHRHRTTRTVNESVTAYRSRGLPGVRVGRSRRYVERNDSAAVDVLLAKLQRHRTVEHNSAVGDRATVDRDFGLSNNVHREAKRWLSTFTVADKDVNRSLRRRQRQRSVRCHSDTVHVNWIVVRTHRNVQAVLEVQDDRSRLARTDCHLRRRTDRPYAGLCNRVRDSTFPAASQNEQARREQIDIPHLTLLKGLRGSWLALQTMQTNRVCIVEYYSIFVKILTNTQ